MSHAADDHPDYFTNPDKQPRPFVTFETRAVEKRVGEGDSVRIEYEDVVFAIIRPAGGRDSVEKVATEWIDSLHTQAAAGRIPPHWPRAYNEALQGFIRGEALPVEGTPIKQWAAITPAERKALLRAEIFTVETLALSNSDMQDRIGMGAIRLIDLAKAYVADKTGPGATLLAMDNLKAENQTLRQQLAALTEAVAELRAQVPGATKASLAVQVAEKVDPINTF